MLRNLSEGNLNQILIGLPGSGKSTWGRYLATDKPYVQEPYGKIWDTLKKFYKSPKEYAFDVQSQFLKEWVSLYQSLDFKNNTYVIDGGPFLSYHVYAKHLFSKGFLSPSQLDDLTYKYYIEFDPVLRLNNVEYIYIKVDPLIAFKRAKSRGREGEKISIEYLYSLQEFLNDYIKNHVPDNRLLVINNNTDCLASCEQCEGRGFNIKIKPEDCENCLGTGLVYV